MKNINNKGFTHGMILLAVVIIFAIAGVGYLVATHAANPVVGTIEAEQMTSAPTATTYSDSNASATKAIKATVNTTLSGSVNLTNPSSSLTVKAYGNSCRGSAGIAVSVDGVSILPKTTLSTSGWSNYTAAKNLSAGTHKVDIFITNAGKVKRCNRNAYVDVTNFYGASATPPTLSLSANPTNVISGSSSTLSWSSSNATSCNASGDWSGAQATSGTQNTGALTATRTYNLSCTGPGGSTSATAQVTVSGGGSAASTQPVGISGTWTQKFNDDFNGSSLDTSKWNNGWYDTGSGITNPVNENEQNCYDVKQVGLANGILSLKAEARQVTCGGKTFPYVAGLVNTYAKYNYTYGVMEARIWGAGSGDKLSNWPAFWALGANWPNDGEIDVMEGLGGQPCYHFHYSGGSPGGCSTVTGAATGWHTYSSNWQPSGITFYYDGKEVGKITAGITSKPMYMVLNYPVSTSISPPITVPATMQIDYVRVWQ